MRFAGREREGGLCWTGLDDQEVIVGMVCRKDAGRENRSAMGRDGKWKGKEGAGTSVI